LAWAEDDADKPALPIREKQRFPATWAGGREAFGWAQVSWRR
jgi:hypothetical protein